MKIIKKDDYFNGRDLLNWFFNDDLDINEWFSLRPFRFGMGVFPKVDISETDKEIKVVANVPGVDLDKLEIEVENDMLIISGKIEKEEEQKDEKFYRMERRYGEFMRQFVLPTKVDADKVDAKIKNGVLTIILPKIGKESKKKVKVEKQD